MPRGFPRGKWQRNGNGFRFTEDEAKFWRPRPELRYSVTGSTDLQTWSPAPFTLPANAAPVQLNLAPLGLTRYFLRVTAQP